jgi:hypothetical protein
MFLEWLVKRHEVQRCVVLSLGTHLNGSSPVVLPYAHDFSDGVAVLHHWGNRDCHSTV